MVLAVAAVVTPPMALGPVIVSETGAVVGTVPCGAVVAVPEPPSARLTLPLYGRIVPVTAEVKLPSLRVLSHGRTPLAPDSARRPGRPARNAVLIGMLASREPAQAARLLA